MTPTDTNLMPLHAVHHNPRPAYATASIMASQKSYNDACQSFQKGMWPHHTSAQLTRHGMERCRAHVHIEHQVQRHVLLPQCNLKIDPICKIGTLTCVPSVRSGLICSKPRMKNANPLRFSGSLSASAWQHHSSPSCIRGSSFRARSSTSTSGV